ncbi:MAG: putative lipoprotein [Labilithrix sp.]|nr:putative lipoprotein [Labilithrix sp.]
MERSIGWLVSGVLGIGAATALLTAACSSSTPDSGFGDDAGGGTSSGASGSSGPGSSSGFGTSGSSGAADAAIADDECRKMDIIFAVDNSGSMSEEQSNLAANFPKFVQVINDYKTKSGAALDYRIAVLSSDVGENKGRYNAKRAPDAPGGCSAGPARPWLERADGDVSKFFSCRAQFGTDGDNIERPLENVFLSVTTAATSNANAGTPFVRDDALLAFVLITDEDEGSAGGDGNLPRPMADYLTGFDTVKGERGRWAASTIAGPSSCNSAFGSAAEAKRLKQFMGDVGTNAVFSSICTGDLTMGLSDALATFDKACKNFPTGPR